jgi:hypothetical protein
MLSAVSANMLDLCMHNKGTYVVQRALYCASNTELVELCQARAFFLLMLCHTGFRRVVQLLNPVAWSIDAQQGRAAAGQGGRPCAVQTLLFPSSCG